MRGGTRGVSVEYASGGDYRSTAGSITAHTLRARSMSLYFFPQTGQDMFFFRFAIRFLRAAIRSYGAGGVDNGRGNGSIQDTWRSKSEIF